MSTIKIWNPTPSSDSEDGRVTLAEAVGQALGSASMCWESPAGAGVFDDTACGVVYDGLMAYLGDWADDQRKQANEATWAKARVVTKEWADIAYELWALACNSTTDGHASVTDWEAARRRLGDRFHAALATLPDEGKAMGDSGEPAAERHVHHTEEPAPDAR
jgi:hypothetical protein